MSRARRSRVLRLCCAAAAAALLAATFSLPVAPASATGPACGPDLGKAVPVVLVHGFNSAPGIFTSGTVPMVTALLAVKGVSVDDTFDYSKFSDQWVTDPHIGKALAEHVACVAAASARAGGPGKVIVIAHSMGGLATRCLFSDACSNTPGAAAAVGMLITLGTPNTGSFLRLGRAGSAAEQALFDAIKISCAASSLPVVPNGAVDAAICTAVEPVLKPLAGPAAVAFTPGSAELAALPSMPAAVPVVALAGRVGVRTTLFWHTLELTGDAGDLVVGTASATAAARADNGLGGPTVVDCGTIDVSLNVFEPGHLQSCWHNSEPSNAAFQSAVVAQVRAYLLRSSVRPLAFGGPGGAYLQTGGRVVRLTTAGTGNRGTWSADGQWYAAGTFTSGSVIVADRAGQDVRTLTCGCDGASFVGNTLEALTRDGTGLVKVDPATGRSTTTPVTGIPPADPAGTPFAVAAVPVGLLVVYPHGPSNFARTGIGWVYLVKPDGTATQLVGGAGMTTRGTFGSPLQGIADDSGRYVAFQGTAHAGWCDNFDGVSVLDTSTGTEASANFASSGPLPVHIVNLSWRPDGTLDVFAAPRPDSCVTDPASGGNPVQRVPGIYTVRGPTIEATTRQAIYYEQATNGLVAEVDGTATVDGVGLEAAAGTLSIRGDGHLIVVAKNVTWAAWAPS